MTVDSQYELPLIAQAQTTGRQGPILLKKQPSCLALGKNLHRVSRQARRRMGRLSRCERDTAACPPLAIE